MRAFKTQRIAITEFKESDINTNYISWLNDHNHMRYSNQRFKTHDEKTTLEYMKTFLNTPNKFFSIKSNSILIGTLTLYFEGDGIANAGILIGTEHAGKGYGKETWKILVDEICPELKIKKLMAGTLSVNRAMLEVFEKTGLTFYEKLEKTEVYEDTLCDVIIYLIKIS